MQVGGVVSGLGYENNSKYKAPNGREYVNKAWWWVDNKIKNQRCKYKNATAPQE